MSRKQRKAAANSKSAEPFTIQEIPLKQPDRSGPKQPTLFDLAAEREAELHKQIPGYKAKKAKDSSAAAVNNGLQPELETAEADDALLTAILYGLTLTTVHITLDILTWHQYAQELDYKSLIKRNIKSTLPLSILLVYIFHAPWFGLTRFEWLRQTLFFCAAAGSGIYVIYLCNDAPFLAVMKRVPPVVTLALWAVLEMGPLSSVASICLVLITSLWQGWKLY